MSDLRAVRFVETRCVKQDENPPTYRSGNKA
jgi:hypothetical protein